MFFNLKTLKNKAINQKFYRRMAIAKLLPPVTKQVVNVNKKVIENLKKSTTNFQG
tara:strand:+ start:129 stop:293 length:165 start_codon:yes stop_codon:yes gene_type:complete